jgi:hypothetical protein
MCGSLSSSCAEAVLIFTAEGDISKWFSDGKTCFVCFEAQQTSKRQIITKGKSLIGILQML